MSLKNRIIYGAAILVTYSCAGNINHQQPVIPPIEAVQTTREQPSLEDSLTILHSQVASLRAKTRRLEAEKRGLDGAH